MARNVEISQASRKRSLQDFSDVNTPQKRSSVSLRREGNSLPSSSPAIFSVMPPGTSSPPRTSPDLPSFRTLPDRSSVPVEDKDNLDKYFTRENTVDPGLAKLGEPVTKLVELVTTLRDNGVARLDIDLPQIVVVGDQSTGKSSLIEGLSAIKVPRKEGTCTRCPLEINLKATQDPWHCKISIVKLYAYKASMSDTDPKLGLGPWTTKYPHALVEHFVDVNNKHEIPHYIAQAQLAVLNPSKNVKAFAIPPCQAMESEVGQEPFSPNVIRLDISAPKLPSLSFFDLPGIIVQDVEPYVPKMIRNLAKSYISSSRSLVLLTVPMDNDRANSSAAGLVYEVNANDRTIGIISKPDRLVEANVEQWKVILENRKFELNLGYRVVMNPADSSVEHGEARRLERHFFNTDPIFNGPLSGFQDRFGTEKLQASLSVQLLSMIRSALPEIEQKVNSRVFKIERELAHLPKIPEGNVVFDIQAKLVNFQRHLAAVIDNTAELSRGHNGLDYRRGTQFFQDWHKCAQILFEKLKGTAPQLDLSDIKPKLAYGATITIDSDSDGDEEETRSTPTKHEISSTSASLTSPAGVSSSFSAKQFQDISSVIEEKTKKFGLLQLREHLHAFNGGVPGIGDPRVFQRLFKESTTHWSILLRQFLRNTADRCKKIVNDLIDITFSDLKETELLRFIKQSAMAFFASLERAQVLLSKRILNIEMGKLLTLDNEGQENNRRLVLEDLNAQLCKTMAEAKVAERKAEAKITVSEEKKIQEQMKLEAHKYHQELHELAGTISYYRVAAHRFADYNSLAIRNEFFDGLKEELWKHVAKELGLNEGADLAKVDDNLKRMMVPSAKDYQRRKDLEHELQLLEQSKRDVLRVLSEGDYEEDDNWDEDMEI